MNRQFVSSQWVISIYLSILAASNDTMETEHAVNSEGQQVQFVVATEGDEVDQEGTQTIVLGKIYLDLRR